MITANSKIKLNYTKISQLSKATTTALEMTAEALKTEIIQTQVIPFDKGTLQGEGFFADCSESSLGRVSLVHNTPYARRLYFHPEYNFQTTENPNARGEWFADWLTGGRYEKFTPEAFKKFYRMAGGL